MSLELVKLAGEGIGWTSGRLVSFCGSMKVREVAYREEKAHLLIGFLNQTKIDSQKGLRKISLTVRIVSLFL